MSLFPQWCQGCLCIPYFRARRPLISLPLRAGQAGPIFRAAWLPTPAVGSPVLLPLLAILLQKGLSAPPSGRDGFLGTVASGTTSPLPKAPEQPQSMFKKNPLSVAGPAGSQE